MTLRVKQKNLLQFWVSYKIIKRFEKLSEGNEKVMAKPKVGCGGAGTQTMPYSAVTEMIVHENPFTKLMKTMKKFKYPAKHYTK